ncbi:hypothetical protein LSG25_08675 [Paralcaligenes sp. KSB-10]|uniref:DUF6622 family protein n=1 Tax=Paralcaligenes sp. KSB-10 TaxID=2901142 RepID=UPI001E2E5F51|nr:DUF6622 family protein [Paralcaligenes sp. KSB-10]UHL65921.1 hypothetical protein LSG25_08675 [Paralcaligenes sp. KSB-10]
MGAITNIVSGTPAWVWVLLVYLIIRGIKATKTTVMQFWRLLIIPLVFTIWGLAGLLTTLRFTAFSTGTWIVAIIVGCYLGGLAARGVAIRANKSRGLIELPGSPFTLVLILAIFAAKYVLGYQSAIDPAAAQSSLYVFFDAGISGLVAGLFIGRVWNYYQKYRDSQDTDLAALASAKG